MKNLVVATGNRGKFMEIESLLSPYFDRIIPLWEFENPPSPDETVTSFRENSVIKAEALSLFSGEMTLADDSGLVVYSLDGAPGVWSARYAGENATDADNNLKLLREMKNIPVESRTAAFVSVVALASPDSSTVTFEGRVEGSILFENRGNGGFGYDPLFLVEGMGKTMAELHLSDKNSISHRGRAIDLLLKHLASRKP